MNALTTEIKTRARLLQKLLETRNTAASKRALILSRQRSWEIPESWQLKHCMNLAAADAGFQNWEHARIVLGGEVRPGEDMGDFWHGPEVAVFINHWYASYAEAQQQLRANEAGYLLPYRCQYLVVTGDYLQALGISAAPEFWNVIGHDLVQGYGSASWLNLAQQRLQSSRTERFNANWDATKIMLDLQSTDVEAERVMKSFVKNGRLVSIPEQRKKRLVILRWLVEQLQFERRYVEADINAFLLQFHADFATLRREFIMNGLMERAEGEYWRV